MSVRSFLSRAAFRTNVATLAAHVAPSALMVVVKADAYGHGMVACSREARLAGASWLGVATPGEALTLRVAGDAGPLLCWLYGPSEDLSPCVLSIIYPSIGSSSGRPMAYDTLGIGQACLGWV